MKKNHLLFLVGAPLFAVLLVAIKIYYSAVIWRYQGPDVIFEIRPNENFSSINSRLQKSEIISSARLFHRYSQWNGVMTKFKTGSYEIKKGFNLLEVYNALINGKSIVSLFTIPEGKNIFEIARMLEERSIVHYKEFINKARDRSFVKELGINADSVEGYLYPESYDFTGRLSAEYVIKKMVAEFNKKTANINFKHPELSKEEIITLASIVEKETGDKSERPIIAGVFLNRLKINMRLQSDPTTIYGMYESYKGNITKKDLLTPTPYNTYTIKALPVGPISNPGRESILAVLNPDKHNYLFFVSQNDGTHIFSESYGDHQEAVVKWQKTKENREGRSWRNKKSDDQSEESN